MYDFIKHCSGFYARITASRRGKGVGGMEGEVMVKGVDEWQ